MRKVRIIIAGSREFSNPFIHYPIMKSTVHSVISDLKLSDEELKQLTIVSGSAKGADTLGERYSLEFGYACTRFPANWNLYGKRAGYIRNTEMAKYATEPSYTGLLIAFWNGKSRGTKHMIDIAKEYDMRIYVKYFN